MNDSTNNGISAVGGIAAGYASYKFLPSVIQKPYARWFLSECRNISQTEHNKYWDAAQKAFADSGLKEKGVELFNINPSNLEQITKDTFQKTGQRMSKFGEKPVKLYKGKRPKWMNILLGPSSEDKLKAALKNISEGNNACFHPGSNNVLVNKDGMGFSAFHEMGHAVNANSKGIKKILSTGRHYAKFAVPLLLATALIKRRKPESTEEPRSTQRKKNFLKDNIGLITFGCMLPTVAEEGLASINGAKMAKKVLNPQELKKLNIINAKAWSTYLLGAALVGIFAQFAVKVKDKLVPPKEKSLQKQSA